MKTRILIGILAGILAGGLAACSEATPAPSGTSTQAPSSTSADAYTIPPRPQLQPPPEPELTGVGIDDAYALAKFYLDLYPYVKATGDTVLWEKYAHPDCVYCETVISAAVGDNESGAWTQASIGILDDVMFSAEGQIDFRIDFLVERSKITYYGDQGVKETDPARHSVVLGIKDVDGTLLVRSFDILLPEVFGKVDL